MQEKEEAGDLGGVPTSDPEETALLSPPRPVSNLILSSITFLFLFFPQPVTGVPGRPSHQKRGRRASPDAPISRSPKALRPPTVSPTKRSRKGAAKPKHFSPRTSKTLKFLMQRPVHLAPDSPEDAHIQSRRQRHSQSKQPRLTLNRIRRRPEDGWEEVGNAESTKIFKVFEDWANDYHPHDYLTAHAVKLQHFGHPLDRPKDIRARPFIISWDTEDGNPPEALDITKDAPVFRVCLRCADNCRHGSESNSKPAKKKQKVESVVSEFEDDDAEGYVDVSDSESPSDGSGSGSDSDEDEDDIGLNRKLNGAGIKKKKPKRSKQKKCPVELHVRIRSFSSFLFD
ncbi:hypothetical protein C8R46DRAFT_891358 [Mycena filopes]|nr:hypothetical protein C8R46DRAFT_912080 [Mycena filopes]KAJ7175275.1 hypothetical protein C8R46DRAFT_891358 [Mycena filopes]